MADTFFDNLKNKNISKDGGKTKTRVLEVWQNASKENKHELVQFVGRGIYNTIMMIGKNGSITARTVILLSRCLDVNPLYLTGEADERGSYNDGVMKKFLKELGYGGLWKEYVKYSKSIAETGSVKSEKAESESAETESEKTSKNQTPFDLTDEQKHNIMEEFDRRARQVIKDAAEEYHREHKHDVMISARPLTEEELADMSEEYDEDTVHPKSEPAISLYNECRHIMVNRLNKKNISKDGAKTKQRAADLWKSATKKDKSEVKNLVSNIYTVIKHTEETGTITAKTAMALSYVINANPFYLTGETDERGDCSDDLLIEFLTKLGYKNLSKPEEKDEAETIDVSAIYESEKNDVAETGNDTQESDEFEEIAEVTAESKPMDLSPEVQAAAANLTEEEIMILMRALLIRAKVGCAEISQLADKIKLLLLLN